MRLLHVTDGYNTHRYYLNGIRTTKAAFDQLYDLAKSTEKLAPEKPAERRNGQWYKYHEVNE